MNTQIVDIMLGDRFVCQMSILPKGSLKILNGEMVEKVTEEDIRLCVESKMPSLKGKPYTIERTEQKLLRR